MGGFFRCGLTSVAIPDSVEVIGEHAFLGCASLISITFGANSRLKTVLGFGHLPIATIDLPDSLEVLGECAFRSYGDLERVNFTAQSHLRILRGFLECGLTEFAVPDSVEELSAFCFAYTPLYNLSFGPHSNLKRMFGPVMCGLGSFEVPDSVEAIGERVFQGCYGLRRLVFGENSRLREIGPAVCIEEQNSDLPGARISSLRIPASVEVIGRDAFSGCFLLEKLEFAPNSKLRELNGFSHARISELDIPDSVEVIGPRSFQPCRNLRIVRFGRDSKLRKVETHFKHAFMRYAETYPKHFRHELEFEGALPGTDREVDWGMNSSDDEAMARWIDEHSAPRDEGEAGDGEDQH
jgi:hypothetical protein